MQVEYYYNVKWTFKIISLRFNIKIVAKFILNHGDTKSIHKRTKQHPQNFRYKTAIVTRDSEAEFRTSIAHLLDVGVQQNY